MACARVSPRQGLTYIIVSAFLLYFLSNGVKFKPPSLPSFLRQGTKYPDFDHYRALRILSDKEFPSDGPSGRTIIVGDVHGMDKPLHALLRKLSYEPASDQLIHVGDLAVKGAHLGSLAVLSFMSNHSITGVRGNHDQDIIKWRSWMNWVSTELDGRYWLDTMHAEWPDAEKAGADLDTWVAQQRSKHGPKWWDRIPKGWKLFSEHYRIARDMGAEEYEYLRSLALTLYVPSAHVYLVHAGLLSSDPRLPSSHKNQPLAHPPRLPHSHATGAAFLASRTRLLRRLQEEAILSQIPQNTDPWVALNIRGVRKDNSITRHHGGKPWAELWNSDMSRCAGYDTSYAEMSKKEDGPLPCLPSTILYGHTASRGLDVRRWSVGLDTGCAKGRRLTALVLGKKQGHHTVADEDVDLRTERIQFGDDGSAETVSVRCS